MIYTVACSVEGMRRDRPRNDKKSRLFPLFEDTLRVLSISLNMMTMNSSDFGDRSGSIHEFPKNLVDFTVRFQWCFCKISLWPG